MLSHRFDEFKWRDWLAGIGREFEPFVMDRPLVHTLNFQKAMINRLAGTLGVSYKAFRPELRPTRPATPQDRSQVVVELQAFSQASDRFMYSDERTVRQQRNVMLRACERTAQAYGLPYLQCG